MFTHTLLLAAALLGTWFPVAPPAVPDASVFTPVGGPPRINLGGKSTGDITKAEWDGLKIVGLHGCVPDARIVALTVCIKDCKAQDASVKGSSGTITSEMRSMIANLPAGTPFTIKVSVKDGKDKAWEVPDATFVWKG